jgi:uncharacterized repeat protein (TIGR03803 family)
MSVVNCLAAVVLAASTAAPLAAQAGTFTTLYSFQGGSKGRFPYGPLTYLDGDAYGTLIAEGYFQGSVYKVNTKTGAYQVVHAFQGGTDGADPTSGVIYSNGLLYGTTDSGGGSGCVLVGVTYGCGTIFSIDPSTGAETILYEFSQDPNAADISPGAFVQVGGTLYAPATYGGTNYEGSVINFNPSTNALSTVYSFTGGADGRAPYPELLFQNGLFYGTTASGGKGCHAFGGCGVVFSIDPSTGAEATLHVFGSKPAGHAPYSNLSYHGGWLFGDTLIGGDPACPRGCGVSFAIKASTGHEKVLETFTNRGESYSSQIIVGGSAYETIPGGGNGYGELLQVDLKTGQQTVLYTFTGGSDGSDPQTPLLYQDGAFYGTTDGGNGTVFKFVP